MQVAPDEVAAVIIEPIQGEGGFIVPAPASLPRWPSGRRRRAWSSSPMKTGFARTGDWFASDHEGVVPDLITTAKGIAGGMPLSAVTGRADLFDAVPEASVEPRRTRWPALAGFDFMERADLRARARRIEKLGRRAWRSSPRRPVGWWGRCAGAGR